MRVSNEISEELYVLTYRIEDDENNPKFSTGKLFHIIQSICSGYAGKFTIKKLVSGYVFKDGILDDAEDMVIKVSGVTQSEADEIAADLCAFLNLKEIKVSKQMHTYHTVQDDLK